MRVLARMEDVGVGRRRAELRGAQRPARPPRSSGSAPADLGRRRRAEFNVNSTAAAARDPVRRARPDAAEEDQDRLLHRRRVAGEAGRTSTRSSSTCCAYREVEKLRVDLRRGPARRGRPPTAASTPRSTRPWPAPAGCQSDQPEPAQHPGAQRGGPRVPQGVRPGARAASCSSPTTTRSSCAASPTSPRTRA